MATVLQLVSADLSTVLFDFNDPTGLANPNGVKTRFGTGGSLQFGSGEPDVVVLTPTSLPGGKVLHRRDPLGLMSWAQRFYGVTYDNLAEAVGVLTGYIAAGGVLKLVLATGGATRYIDFEPSTAPVLLNGQGMGLWKLLTLNDTPEGDRKSTRLNSSHLTQSRMPSSA